MIISDLLTQVAVEGADKLANHWREQAPAQAIGACAWALIAPQAKSFPKAQIEEALGGILGEEALAAAALDPGSAGVVEREVALGFLARCDRAFMASHRRERGMFFTPAPVAQALIARLGPLDDGWIGDLSAGHGQLLLAAATHEPQRRCFGVERQLEVAIACALRLWWLRQSQGLRCQDRVFWGDGLWLGWREQLDGEVAALVGNPPYVGEKGNRGYFEQLKRDHPDLEPWFGPRQDLLYLFFHRGLDWLKPGAKLAYLTSAYWLQATGALRLRQDLSQRCDALALYKYEGQRLFEDAPGHESLVTVAQRGQGPARGLSQLIIAGADGREEAPQEAQPFALGDAHEQPWRPFVHGESRRWLEAWRGQTTSLASLISDRQGFVSGADRVDKRRLASLTSANPGLNVALGAPIFLFEREQIPAALTPLMGRWLLPVLRGGSIEPGKIYGEAESERAPMWALYIDGPLEGRASAEDEALIKAHLEPFRGLLEQRREVQLGLIPWYRLHWPRDRAEQRHIKLVCPRRASSPSFALELGAHVVSSDCTYLPAPAWSSAPVDDLRLMMEVLNSESCARALRYTGKLKGALLEFYAQPLRAWPVPLERREDRLALSPSFADSQEGERILAKLQA